MRMCGIENYKNVFEHEKNRKKTESLCKRTKMGVISCKIFFIMRPVDVTKHTSEK